MNNRIVLAVVNRTWNHHEETHHQTESMVEENSASVLFDNQQPGYDDYVNKHGHHFSKKLAKWAIDRMENDDGSSDHHGIEQVKSIWESAGFGLPKSMTWGDVAYSYNMHHADYYPDPLKTDKEVLREAYKDVYDKDGYPEKIFNRWLSDIVGKGIEVPWSDLI